MKFLQYRWFGIEDARTNLELKDGATAIDIPFQASEENIRGKLLKSLGIQAFPGTKIILSGNFNIQNINNTEEITKISSPSLVINNSGFYQRDYRDEQFFLENLAIEIFPNINYEQYGIIIDLIIDDNIENTIINPNYWVDI